MRYTWLFFDADDTLFDYPRAERQALAAAFGDLHLDFSPAVMAAYSQYNQQVWRAFEQGQISAVQLRLVRFERLLAQFELNADAGELSRCYLLRLSEGAGLIEDAEQLISGLAGRYQLGLVTNGLPEVQRPRLARSVLANRFAFAAISEEIRVAKPDPRFFQAALALAGNPNPAEVLVIGDSLTSDIRGGFQSGLDTLWYNPASLPADPRWPATFEVHSLDEIARLLA